MSCAVLTTRHVAKRFGRRQVLREVSFDLARGTLTGIVGENGSGKTTLLRILVGLLKPERGEVARHGSVGFCPQAPELFESLTVGENLHWFATAYGLGGRRGKRAFEVRKRELLQRYGFLDCEHVLVRQLSGGTRQKLNLAIALLHEPDVLVLDEPYAAFDWDTYLRFWDHVDELRRQGTAVLLVSHLVYDRSRLDQLLELRKGVLQCA